MTEFESQFRDALKRADEGGGLGCFNAEFTVVIIVKGQAIQCSNLPRKMAAAAVSGGAKAGDIFTWDGDRYKIVFDSDDDPYCNRVPVIVTRSTEEASLESEWEAERAKFGWTGAKAKRYNKRVDGEKSRVHNAFFEGHWQELADMLDDATLTAVTRRLCYHNLCYRDAKGKYMRKSGKPLAQPPTVTYQE